MCFASVRAELALFCWSQHDLHAWTDLTQHAHNLPCVDAWLCCAGWWRGRLPAGQQLHGVRQSNNSCAAPLSHGDLYNTCKPLETFANLHYHCTGLRSHSHAHGVLKRGMRYWRRSSERLPCRRVACVIKPDMQEQDQHTMPMCRTVRKGCGRNACRHAPRHHSARGPSTEAHSVTPSASCTASAQQQSMINCH